MSAQSGTSGEFEVVERRDRRVAMRDGVRLATDVFLPARDGKPMEAPSPAVLVRSAYDRTHFADEARFFASHGYVAVTQDVRGTFASEGEFFPFVNEHLDGVDVLDWAAALPECNGKVGMWGCSYMSWVQLAVAGQGHPALACMIPFGVAIDTFHHYAYPQGALQLGMLRWVIFDVWRRAARDNPSLAAKIDAIDFIRFAAQMPWRRGKTVLAESPQYEDIILSYIANRTYNDFWRQPGQGFDLYFDRFPDVPMLWVSGWWDGYPRSECEGYLKMNALGRGGRQHLLLGPWVHNQMSGNTAGDVDFSPNADIGRRGTMLAFFNRHLRGDSDAAETPRVRAFIMGGGSGRKTPQGLLHHGGQWWHGEAWPPPGMAPTPWYLHGDGTLSPQRPGRQDDAPTTYRHDPDDPVPSIAPPWMFIGYQQRGPADQREPTELTGKCIPGRPLAQRGDVRVFQSPPLARPLRLLGPLTARLFVSSDAPDTDFAVKLVDVYPPNEDYPDGYAMIVAEGMLRMRYRDGNDNGNALLSPGQVYEVNMECFPAANLFAKGHRVRVDIASSNFPRHEINTNTGDPFSDQRRIATNSVYHDLARPSCVTLPVFDAV